MQLGSGGHKRFPQSRGHLVLLVFGTGILACWPLKHSVIAIASERFSPCSHLAARIFSNMPRPPNRKRVVEIVWRWMLREDARRWFSEVVLRDAPGSSSMTFEGWLLDLEAAVDRSGTFWYRVAVADITDID